MFSHPSKNTKYLPNFALGILPGRISQIFHRLFGGCENKKICFWGFLTLNISSEFSWNGPCYLLVNFRFSNFISFSRCVICMIEFVFGDHVRYLPCLHTYHTKCIDDWLMRSFICPSCMEPVDAALLITYESQSWTKNELRPCVYTCAMFGRTCASWKRSTLSDMCVMLNNYTEQRC